MSAQLATQLYCSVEARGPPGSRRAANSVQLPGLRKTKLNFGWTLWRDAKDTPLVIEETREYCDLIWGRLGIGRACLLPKAAGDINSTGCDRFQLVECEAK